MKPGALIALYDRLVLGRPRTALAVLLAAFVFFGFQTRDFRLDASADSLILEHDDDLRYFRQASARYGAEDFLVLAFTPKGDLFSDETLARVKALRDDVAALEAVSSVVSVLDVPLLLSPPIAITELRGAARTLLTPGTDRAAARKELAESPLFREQLVSPDMRTTGMLVNLKRDEAVESRRARRTQLREKRYRKEPLSAEEAAELKGLERWHWDQKLADKRARHDLVKAVRGVLDRHRAEGELFLGGAPMVVDDMVSFVRKDILVFGLGVLLLMVATLFVIFRRARWVALPLACCAASALVMAGLLGLAGWEVTVVSSNFISLQLIMTMSFSIHLIGRYREVLEERPSADHREVVREAVRTIFLPSSFTCATTIAGFASLLSSNILPVMDFGWMMSAGLCVSLAVTFLLLPASLMFLPKDAVRAAPEAGAPVTGYFARFTLRRGGLIVAAGAALAAVTAAGAARLEVENSFINYFKSSTEIHRGMKMIDENLGGTTPLDLVVSFGAAPAGPAAPAAPLSAADEKDFALMDEAPARDDFALMEGEGAAPEDPRRYWFTPEKLALIERVHDFLDADPATGKVMSLATVVKMVRPLKAGGELDNLDLALIFNEMPPDIRKVLVDPYVDAASNEARLTVRIRDSLKTLRRDDFLKGLRARLKDEFGLGEDRVRLTSFMVLYNNMLQSLYRSQISASSLVTFPLLIMFVVIFRSFKVGALAMVPNVIATTLVLGFMGWMKIPLDMMTITIVSISLGMGVEDTILYIHRFREEIEKDWDYPAAVERCHLSVGNPMLYTSVVVTLGFSILVLSNFIPTILFGLFTAATMVIALVAALTLLPALVVLAKPFGRGPAKAP